MRTILFPTDFSTNAEHALGFALELAEKEGAKLILMHAFDIPYDFASRVYDEMKAQRDFSEKRLIEIVDKCKEDERYKKLNFETITIPGEAVSAIKKVATDKDASLIVMGTRGASGIKKIVFGSIAAEVILLTKFPVLAIPEHAVFDKMDKIVFATDYHEEDLDMLREVVGFARLFDAEIHMLHIANKDTLKERATFNGFCQMVAERHLYQKIQHELVIGDDFFEAMTGYAKKAKASIFAMASHRKTSLEKLLSISMTRDMVYQTELPLLVLKAEKRIVF